MSRIDTQGIKESLLHTLGSSSTEYLNYLHTLLVSNKKPKEMKLSSQATKLHNQLIQGIIANSCQNVPPPALSSTIQNFKSGSKQEENKAFMKRTLLSLSREDRQRLRALKPQNQPVVSILPCSESTCIKSRELPSLETLKRRMLWIASKEPDLVASVSDDAVASLSLGLETYIMNLLEEMVTRSRVNQDSDTRASKRLRTELLREDSLIQPLFLVYE